MCIRDRLGYLGKGLVKAFGELQVGRDLAQGQAGQAAQGEQASRNGGQHELQVPYCLLYTSRCV